MICEASADRLGDVLRVEQAPEVALEVQTRLLRDLVVNLRRARIIEQERHQAIVRAVRIALHNGKRQRRARQAVVAFLAPHVAGLEDVRPERMAGVDVPALHRDQVVAALHERVVELREVQALGVGVVVERVLDLDEVAARGLAGKREPPLEHVIRQVGALRHGEARDAIDGARRPRVRSSGIRTSGSCGFLPPPAPSLTVMSSA